MKTANAITNRYQDFTVLDLRQRAHHVEGHGPFMVTPEASTS